MESENTFKEIGKRVPYSVPDNFFEPLTEQTLTHAKKRLRHSRTRQIILWASLAASVLLFTFHSELRMEVGKMTGMKEVFVQNKKSQPVSFQDGVPETMEEKVAEQDYSRLIFGTPDEESEEADPYHETMENLFALLSEEELLELAYWLSAELFFNELIEE